MAAPRLWSQEEDRILRETRANNPAVSWKEVARLSGLDRSGWACRERWNSRANPDLIQTPFSQEEDDVIIAWQALLGNDWAAIAEYLPGRSREAIKSRWRRRLRKIAQRTTEKNRTDPQDPEAGPSMPPPDSASGPMGDVLSDNEIDEILDSFISQLEARRLELSSVQHQAEDQDAILEPAPVHHQAEDQDAILEPAPVHHHAQDQDM